MEFEWLTNGVNKEIISVSLKIYPSRAEISVGFSKVYGPVSEIKRSSNIEKMNSQSFFELFSLESKQNFWIIGGFNF